MVWIVENKGEEKVKIRCDSCGKRIWFWQSYCRFIVKCETGTLAFVTHARSGCIEKANERLNR